MTERIPKSAFIATLVLGPVVLAYLAYSRPDYFTSQTYLGGILVIEFLVAAVWMYKRVFFPLVIGAFLLAGVNLPVGHFWGALRWVFLCVGALTGSFLILKERIHHFGVFHLVAAFAVLATLVSASVSQFKQVAFLKALSFALLFLYGSTGARLAVTGRENRFFAGLLAATECFVGAMAILYAMGIGAMGNPNSLGAVMGVVATPILFWGALLEEPPFVHRRRLVLYALCMYLTFHSHARAGMAAALVSTGLLCLALRQYKVIVAGIGMVVIVVAAGWILEPEAMSNTFSTLEMSVIYKGSSEGSLLASRQSPWQAAIDGIRGHWWFGTGLGTAENSNDPREHTGVFSSSTLVTTENGSSYLSAMAGVGIFGLVPFSLLLLLLIGKIVRTTVWLRKSGNACHPAAPLAMVMVAGLIHAGFEDWLFAPGYYLCIVFWSLAFVLVDVAPSTVPLFGFTWRSRPAQRGFVDIPASR
jgi:O-antigen ligase